MRKNVVAMSVAVMIGGLGLAGVAHAGAFEGTAPTTTATNLVFNGDGIGHSLLVPYYTVQNGQSTLLSVVNHDTINGKAVKVRFRGAANSDDVFDFTLLLSPGDVWNAEVNQNNGAARLVTFDNTCTLPATVRTNGAAGSPFPTTRLGGAGGAGTREGYVEIFNMADIPPRNPSNELHAQAGPTTDLTGAAGTNSKTYDAIKHNTSGVAPCTAASLSYLSDYANIDTIAEVQQRGFRVPTTGLSGQWTILDVPNATSFSGNATAVVAVDGANAPARGRTVLFSQTATAVDKANARNWTSDPLLRGNGLLAPAQYDFPDMSTPYLTAASYGGAAVTHPLAQAFMLTRALAVQTVQNEYYSGSDIQASSDWTFTMPTRRYNVALSYARLDASPSQATTARVYSDYTESAVAGAANYFSGQGQRIVAATGAGDNPGVYTAGLGANGGNTTLNATTRQICVLDIGQAAYNREEGSITASTDFVVSPGEPGEPLSFCGEASVLKFNTEGDSVLSASIAAKSLSADGFDRGWLRLTTPGLAGAGLPILGAAFLKAIHPNAAPGVAGNFGMSFAHKATR